MTQQSRSSLTPLTKTSLGNYMNNREQQECHGSRVMNAGYLIISR